VKILKRFPHLLLCLLAARASAEDGLALFKSAGERINEGRLTDACDLLARAATALQADPQTPPDQVAAVWQTLGSAYYKRRLYSKAEQAYRRAIEQAAPLRRVEVFSSLAGVYQDVGKNDAAVAALRQAEEEMVTITALPWEGRIALLNNRATLQGRIGRLPDA